MSTTIKLPAVVTVKQLAEALQQPVTTVITKLMGFGVLATINEDVDFDTASIIADDFGIMVEREELRATSFSAVSADVVEHDVRPRPPVVTIMGHVDHGKTTLLDTIRKTSVAAKESGGITQHISSYQVQVTPKDGSAARTVTFLDTPGHSAFEAMRRHGAQITDLVVLVVAADDGIKPQTVEAINHAKAHNVTMLVAINKIDKPDADIEKVKAELTEYGLVPEEWGGQTVIAPISGKTGQGLPELLELILLATDIRELKADYGVPAIGVVVESHLQQGVGPVATLLIQNGVLHAGDFVALGAVSGRVRTLTDFRGKKTDEATPAMPVEISGLDGVPEFGEQLAVFAHERDAREAARQFLRTGTAKRASASLSSSASSATQKEGKKSVLNVVIKADTNGSLEAIRTTLDNYKSEDVEVRIVSGGVGEISEGDVTLAKTAKALIVGFHSRIPASVKQLAEREKVGISLYTVIYELFDAIREVLADLMPIESVEVPFGHLTVLARFRDNRKHAVLGGRVEEGVAEAKLHARAVRNKTQVAIGTVLEVRRGKDAVKQVKAGTECGVEFTFREGHDDVAVGDTIMFFKVEQRKKQLVLS
jgi:translation initiation factor IF-2